MSLKFVLGSSKIQRIMWVQISCPLVFFLGYQYFMVVFYNKYYNLYCQILFMIGIIILMLKNDNVDSLVIIIIICSCIG